MWGSVFQREQAGMLRGNWDLPFVGMLQGSPSLLFWRGQAVCVPFPLAWGPSCKKKNRRKTERCLGSKTHPSEQFPSPTGTLWDLGSRGCLFLTSPWQNSLLKCWQAAAPGSFGVMDARRCRVITLPALAPFGVCFPPLLGLSFFHGKSEEQEADC